jgi:molecular chaperone DnaK
VSAKDKATGKEQSIIIKASSGLSDEEIEGMVKDAEANAEADRVFEELTSARNMAEGMVNASRKALEDGADKATDEEKAAIESAIAEVEEALKGEDKDAIEAASTKLTEASSSLAQKMYAEQGEQGGEAPQAEAENDQAAGGDDVVDAEFEEVKEDNK